MTTEVRFTRVPVTGLLACQVPVLPGSPDTAAPIEDRTELCACDAHWMVGMIATCDHHVKEVCGIMEVDWPELVAEAGRPLGSADRPWAGRLRHSQAAAREQQVHFGREPGSVDGLEG